MRNLITLFFLFFLSFQVLGQEKDRPSELLKADSLYKHQVYDMAQKVYSEYALTNGDVQSLHLASLCYEKQTGHSYCAYIQQAIANGFKMTEAELFFYGCDPKTFKKVKPKVK